MTPPRDKPDQQPSTPAPDAEVVHVHGEVVHAPTPGELPEARRDRVRRGVKRELAIVRAQVGALSRNPAAVATATVATTLAVKAVRQAVNGGALSRSRAAAPTVVTGYFFSHVHVVHHVVHHVVRDVVDPRGLARTVE